MEIWVAINIKSIIGIKFTKNSRQVRLHCWNQSTTTERNNINIAQILLKLDEKEISHN